MVIDKKLYDKNYKEKHKDKIKEQKKLYYLKNREKILNSSKKWMQTNSVLCKTRVQSYSQNNKDKLKLRSKNYYQWKYKIYRNLIHIKI